MINLLVVEIIVTTSLTKVAVGSVGLGCLVSVREAEEGTATRVLHLLSKCLVSPNLHIRDRATSRLHGLLKVSTSQLWDRVLGINIFHGILSSSLTSLGLLDVGGDSLLDGELTSTLCDEAQIGTRVTVSLGRNIVNVDVRSDGCLAELSTEDTSTGLLVRQRNVDEGVKTSRTAKSVVELFGSVGGTNDEDVLL